MTLSAPCRESDAGEVAGASRAPAREHPPYLVFVHPAVNKLEAFLQFWHQQPKPWPYRFTLLLDDDVHLRPGDVSRLFQLCERHDTYLAQPATRWSGQTAHSTLVRNPLCVLRQVSFVDRTAPCLSSAALTKLVKTFDWTRNSWGPWGADWAWAAFLEGNPSLHVIDAVLMEKRAGRKKRSGKARPGHVASRRQRPNELAQDPDEIEQTGWLFPLFEAPHTLSRGHVFRAAVPRWAAPGLMFALEHLKTSIRARVSA